MAALASACAAGLLSLRAATFVSVLVAREAVLEHGLPNKRFFFQGDDIDFTARVLRRGVGLFVPSSVVEHRTKVAHDAVLDPSGTRFYYSARNTIYQLRGSAWAREEKPALAFTLVRSCIRYLRLHRFARVNVLTVGRALRDGLGRLDAI